MNSAMFLNTLQTWCGSRSRLHYRSDSFTPTLIRDADDHRVKDFRMRFESVFNFFGEDLFTTTIDTYRASTNKSDRSVFFELSKISGN